MTDPGWHPDPTGRSHHRYYDGSRWTEHVADAAGSPSVDAVGAPDASGGPGGPGRPGDSPAGASGIVVGPPPGRQSSAPPAGGAWGGAAADGSWGGAAPARKKVDKVSIGGLVLAVVGLGLGLASLFALPWLEVSGSEVSFLDARRGVDDSGVFGAVAGGLMINIAYFIVGVGGVVALAKAVGARGAGIAGLVVALIGLVALIVVGVIAIPVEGGDPAVAGTDAGTVLESEGEDRLTATAIFTAVVMVIATVLAGVGLLLHGIAGRILPLFGLGLVGLFALGGILVLRDNFTELGLGLAQVDLGLGSWAIVVAAGLLAISTAVPGGRREV